MATIHKLHKEGSTIYPATISDAIVHQDTRATLTQMINDYNVTQLYPTSGLSGGSTYDLETAVGVLSSHLTTAEKRVGTKLSFTDSVTGKVKEYIFQGGTFSSTSGWVPSVTIEDLNTAFADSVHISSQDLSEREKQIARSNIGASSVNETQIIMSQLADLRTRDNYRTRDLGYTGVTMGTGEVICATPDIAGDSGTSWVVFRYGNVDSPSSAYLRQTHEELTTIQQLYFNEKNVSRRTITFTDSTKSQVQSVGSWSTVTSLYGVQVTSSGINLRLMNPMLYDNGGLYTLNLPSATTGFGGMMSAADKSKLDGIVPENMTNIAWSELKTLRDSGELLPGQYYRITDYVTTTTQSFTRSAGHPFDIILQADSTNVLSEDAWAIKHGDDDYFAGSKLEAWELKYCIDNDTTRFAWADASNGKGVIYWMKDEFDNECPYDFKNIQFASYKILAFDKNPSLVNTYSGYKDSNGNLYPSGATIDMSSVLYRFTFDYIFTGVSMDFSLNKSERVCTDNVIKPRIYNNKLALNNIVLGRGNLGTTTGTTKGNKFDVDCNNMRFSDGCFNNTFGRGCFNNTFGRGCFYNTFGNECFSNTFGYNCSNNTLGGSCNNNTFGNYCFNDTFGYNCYNNTLGGSCNNNTFGTYCYSNTFGNDCDNNNFGNYCYSNEVLNYTTNCQIQNTSNHILTSNEVIYGTDELYQTKDNIIYPISHPDLSTQPSILPQRFGNLNIYEVLIPLNSQIIDCVIDESYIPKNATILESSIFCDQTQLSSYSKKTSEGWILSAYSFDDTIESNDWWALVRYRTNDGDYYYYSPSEPEDHDFSKDYLTFTALEDTTFTFTDNDLQYSLDDDATWNTLTAGTASPTITAGNKIMWKQTGLTPTNAGIGTFSATGNFEASGNIMSLYYGDDFIGQTDLTGKIAAFHGLFSNNNKLVTCKNLILPATTLETNCYAGMFSSCTSLVTAPALPATTLADGCYTFMFIGCSQLNYIKAMFTTEPNDVYTQTWVIDVSSSGTFVKNSAATWDVTGSNGIPEGWTVETASE